MPPKGFDRPNPQDYSFQLKKAVTERLGLNLANGFDIQGKLENPDGTFSEIFVIDFPTHTILNEERYLEIENALINRLQGRITGVHIAVETLVVKQLRTLEVLRNFLQSPKSNNVIETCFNFNTGQLSLTNLYKLMRANSFFVSIQDLVDLIPFSFLSQSDFSNYIEGIRNGESYIPLTLKLIPNVDQKTISSRLDNARAIESIQLNPDCIILDGALDFQRIMIHSPASRARLLSMMGGLRVNYFAIQEDGAKITIGGKEFEDTVFAGIISSLWILHSQKYAYGDLFDSLALHVTKPGSNSPMNTLVQFSDTTHVASIDESNFFNLLYRDLEDLDNLIKILRRNANMTQPEIENASNLVKHYVDLILKTYPRVDQLNFIGRRLLNTFKQEI